MNYRVAALGCWLIVLVGGVGLLAAHQFAPGASGPAPLRWPESKPADRFRVVMFVHPHCPCTPVALRNFAALVKESRCEAVVYVVTDEPARTPNGRAAAQVAGAECRADPDGGTAKRFGAMTSGHVFLYTSDGRLTFEGGITEGRGHEGDNPGLRALAARLAGREDALASFPVFGCPLQ